MKIKKFKEICHLLPENSWAFEVGNLLKRKLGEQDVLVIEDDFKIETLDLETLGIETSSEGHRPFLIIVQGSVYAKNIFNLNMDSSTGLIVLGNLTVNTMIVGGQEIYVGGDLTVKDCFWGHYSYGSLKVAGEITARVFVATDGYRYGHEHKQIHSEYILSDVIEEYQDGLYDQEFPAAVFVDDVFVAKGKDEKPATGWAEYLDLFKMVELLKENTSSLLKNPIIFKTKQQHEQEELQKVPSLFSPTEFKDEVGFFAQKNNFKKMMSLVLTEGHGDQTFEFDGYEIRVKTFDPKVKDQEKEEFILATHCDGHQIYIHIPRQEGVQGLRLRHLLGHNLAVAFRSSPDAKFEVMFSEIELPECVPILNFFWSRLLQRLERGIYFKTIFDRTVRVDQIQEWLSLPVVEEKYNDFWDEGDNFGFWRGNQVYRFNRNGEGGLAGVVTLGREITSITMANSGHDMDDHHGHDDADDDDDSHDNDYDNDDNVEDADNAEDSEAADAFDCDKFYYRLNAIQNPTYVELEYLSSQEGLAEGRFNGENTSVSIFDWELYRQALSRWQRADADIRAENAGYLTEKRLKIQLKAAQHIWSKAPKGQPQAVPVDVVDFAGVSFKVINRHRAQELVQELENFREENIYDVFEDKILFPDKEPNSFFLYIDEDVDIESLELLSHIEAHSGLSILGYIFQKDLAVEKFILAQTGTYSPALIVLGNVQATNINLFGNTHFIAGNLTCESILGLGDVGEIYVKGAAVANLIYSADVNMHFDTFSALDAAISRKWPSIFINSSVLDEDQNSIRYENYLPSTHFLSDIVSDDLIVIDEGGDECLNNDLMADIFQENGSLLDLEKQDRYNYIHFPAELQKMSEQLLASEQIKTSASLADKSEENLQFIFFRYLYENRLYQQWYYLIEGDFNIRMRLVQQIGSLEAALLLEYLDGDGEVLFRWMEGLAENKVFEIKCVKHAVFKIFKQLHKLDSFKDSVILDYAPAELAKFEISKSEIGMLRLTSGPLSVWDPFIQSGAHPLPVEIGSGDYPVQMYTQPLGICLLVLRLSEGKTLRWSKVGAVKVEGRLACLAGQDGLRALAQHAELLNATSSEIRGTSYNEVIRTLCEESAAAAVIYQPMENTPANVILFSTGGRDSCTVWIGQDEADEWTAIVCGSHF